MTTALETLKQLRGKYLGDGIRSLKVDDFLVETEAFAAEQVAQYKQDAERYRYIRQHPAMLLHLSHRDFDVAVDNAIRARAQEE